MAVMSDLAGAHAKVERAKEHILHLGLEKTAFLATNPYGVTPEYYAPKDFTAYFMDRFVPVPLQIALIAGDAVHNLRSALDLLASALVRRGPGRKSGHTYFPICKSVEAYKAEAPRKVEGMLVADIEAIDMLKPYAGGNDMLWGLQKLDIVDKHQLLSTPVVGVNRIGIRLSTELVTRLFGGHLRFRAPDAIRREVMWYDHRSTLVASKQGDPVISVKGNYETNQDIELTFDIALGEAEVFKGRPILEALREVSDLVSGIVNSFESL